MLFIITFEFDDWVSANIQMKPNTGSHSPARSHSVVESAGDRPALPVSGFGE